LTRAQQRALEQLAALWSDRAFVLIGASALQLQLPFERATRDLDVTLAADLDEFPAGLDKLVGWKRHLSREHEWVGPGRVRVDVLPASPVLRAQGYVEMAALPGTGCWDRTPVVTVTEPPSRTRSRAARMTLT
jgi:hypothetical protein